MQRVAIFGGTFNPIHWGHLITAEAALNQAHLDRIIWVPSHRPPHRTYSDVVSFQHRMEMVKRAIADHNAFFLSTVELDRPGNSYAIDTFTELQILYPNNQWFWLIGLDAFQSLPRWYRGQELAAQCSWLIAPRAATASSTAVTMPTPASSTAGNTSADLACQHVAHCMAQQSVTLQWQLLDMPFINISSSLIRHYRGDRHSIRYLLPDTVNDYIIEHSLYL
jgi:nicotinate-nucleotide adenylyltransferase